MSKNNPYEVAARRLSNARDRYVDAKTDLSQAIDAYNAVVEGDNVLGAALAERPSYWVHAQAWEA